VIGDIPRLLLAGIWLVLGHPLMGLLLFVTIIGIAFCAASSSRVAWRSLHRQDDRAERLAGAAGLAPVQLP
jgi:uncharacterized membrane protein YccF (DUF307 family)